MNGSTSTTQIDDSRLLQTILDSGRECALIVDSELRVAAANSSAETVFGRPISLLVGKRLAEIVRDLDLHNAFRAALSGLSTTDVRVEISAPVRRTFDVHVAPISLGEAQRAIGYFYDKTQVERLELVRQEFLSNISHELRTPLTSILAFVETLEDGAIDDEANSRRFLGVIRRNAERMSALIADILELSLIESGKVSIDKRPIDISRLTDDIFGTLVVKAAEYDVELVNLIPAKTQVPADSVRLEQMLVNLIDNAIKFNRRGGSVTVACDQRDDACRIEVADTGEGIMPEHLTRIFERFYRVDRARSREVGGTGLGLAIVKHLARLHGGEVTVTSNLSEGTSFMIELPVD